jgi:hypothetical protein
MRASGIIIVSAMIWTSSVRMSMGFLMLATWKQWIFEPLDSCLLVSHRKSVRSNLEVVNQLVRIFRVIRLHRDT